MCSSAPAPSTRSELSRSRTGWTLVGPGSCSRRPSAGSPLERRVDAGGVVEGPALLRSGASVSHLSYVGDSVLGRDANFGAETQVVNLRHDGNDVRMRAKRASVSTGRRKFSVVRGGGAHTGIDTSLSVDVTLMSCPAIRSGETVLEDRRCGRDFHPKSAV